LFKVNSYYIYRYTIIPTASAKLLRSVAEALTLDVDVEAVIEGEKRKLYRFLEPMVDLYFDAALNRCYTGFAGGLP
jgi:hypothetical protein